MTGYESKKAMAQDKITDEQGRPMTYWGGKAQPAQDLSEQGRNRSAVLGNNVEAMMDAGLPFLKALETTLKVYDHDVPKLGCVNHDCDKCKAQPAQEPVAWMHVQGDYEEPSWRQLDDDEIEMGWKQYPLYTAPSQRPWVGMPEDEKEKFVIAYYPSNWDRKTAVALMNNYEAYLKEKNNG